MELSILNDILQEFEKDHHCHIHSELVKTSRPEEFFAMSIIPDDGTMNQIIDALVKKQAGKVLPLWKRCTSWTLEVDSQVVRLLTDNELKALTYHELGHCIQNTGAATRLMESMQFYLATTNVGQRAMLTKTKLKNVLKIPFISECRIMKNLNEVKMHLKQERAMQKEYKAASYAAKNGYFNELMSAMGKITRQFESGKGWNRKDRDASYAFATKTLENIKKRQMKLSQAQMKGLKKYLPQSELSKAVAELDADFETTRLLEEDAIHVYDKAFKEAYFVESGFFKKKVKAVTQDQIAYIEEQLNHLQSETDRSMLLSYINGKLEGVEWQILAHGNPTLMKKYILEPLPILQKEQKILEDLKIRLLKARILPKPYELIIPDYPTGYEG